MRKIPDTEADQLKQLQGVARRFQPNQPWNGNDTILLYTGFHGFVNHAKREWNTEVTFPFTARMTVRDFREQLVQA